MAETAWLAVKGNTMAAVSAAHRFGTDAILLADFSTPSRGETVCELGTGCGAVALRLCAEGDAAAVHGVDIDPDAIALAQMGADVFDGTPKPTFAVADWAQPATVAPAGSFRRVVCNPPYFPPDSGGVSEDAAVRRARHELPETLNDVCRAAAWLLQFGGRFWRLRYPQGWQRRHSVRAHNYKHIQAGYYRRAGHWGVRRGLHHGPYPDEGVSG